MATTRTGSAFVRDLERALMADAREEIAVAIRVGVLMALGYNRRGVGERLELTPAQVGSAVERLRRVAPELERATS